MWLKNLNKIKTNNNSQGNQDGLIEYIISNVNIENRFCVEFGYSSNDYIDFGDSGANCSNLVLNHGWDNLFMDGSNQNEKINLFKHFITTDNILDLFDKYNVPKRLGYLSIDVDSTDLWLTDKILEKYSPTFFSVEFNPNVPIDYAITLPNDPKKSVWLGSKVFGCSLKCLYIVGKKHGYTLIFAGKFSKDGHHDAFFVRNDQLMGVVNLPTLEDFRDVCEPIHGKDNKRQYRLCLDYEYFLKTNDLQKSQHKIKSIARKFFCK